MIMICLNGREAIIETVLEHCKNISSFKLIPELFLLT